MSPGPKRGCRAFVIGFLVVLALAVAGGAWLWQRYASFGDQAIAGLQAGASVAWYR